jgi:succinate dehydrogenase / fumarate reductase, cytochrome b subunit
MNLLVLIKRFYSSSVGKKLLVALSGAALLLFLLGHLVGNLLIYMGQEVLNSYAEFLHHSLHGMGVWIARVGLLSAFVVHIVATIHLVMQNRAAREKRYQFETTAKASKASRTMIISGTIILSFVIFHLLHFTILPNDLVDSTTSDHLRPDVYAMVVQGFSNIFISLFYIVSMAFLCFHLSHGFASVFQTLGLRTDKTGELIQWAGWGYAALIFFGNISIPIAILLGFVK